MHKRILLAALLAAAAVASPARATVDSTCSSSTLVGNGVTTAFTFSCRFLKNADISVTVASVTKSQGVDYSVSGAGNASGTITFTTAPANGASIVITRTVDYKQQASLRTTRYDGATVESAIDKLAMGQQQLQNLYTNPPATVLSANVTAKLNNIRFADQFANIQAAITDAGTTGAVIIPSSYAASDTFTNPNNVPVVDLRGGAGRWRGFLTPRDFGAVGDGSNDDTAAVQSCINAGNCMVPAGSFKIAPGTLTMTSGNRLFGLGKPSKIVYAGAPSAHWIQILGAAGNPSKTDITIEGVSFEATQRSKLFFVVYARGVKNFTFRNNFVTNISAVQTDVNYTVSAPDRPIGGGITTLAAAGLSSPDNLNESIKFEGNRVRSDTAYGAESNRGNWIYCVQANYAQNVVVTHNTCEHANIVYWGGDSSSTSDGADGAFRAVQNLNISVNYVLGGNAGIWGTNGLGVTITGNTVKEGLDSGIAPEGSVNVTVSGNSIKNCKNYSLATFGTSRDVNISGNTSRIDGDFPFTIVGTGAQWQEHFSLRDAGVTLRPKNTTLTGNTFETIGFVANSDYYPHDSLTISNNTFHNACLQATANGGGTVHFTGNQFFIGNDITVGGASSGGAGCWTNELVHLMVNDSVGMGDSAVTNNRIVSSVAQPAATKALFVDHITATKNAHALVDGNFVQAFGTCLVMKTTISGGTTPFEIVSHNVFSGCTTQINDSTTAGAVKVFYANMRQDGTGEQPAFVSKTQAALGTPGNGTVYYCSDCTIANPCAGAGTGAIAKRLNGVWVCN